MSSKSKRSSDDISPTPVSSPAKPAAKPQRQRATASPIKLADYLPDEGTAEKETHPETEEADQPEVVVHMRELMCYSYHSPTSTNPRIHKSPPPDRKRKRKRKFGISTGVAPSRN